MKTSWRKKSTYPHEDEYPILKVSKKDHLTVRNASNGIQIFGKPGSGKTNGSGRNLAMSFLTNGYGGLVLSVKNGECENWLKNAQLTGQLYRIVVLSSFERLKAYEEQYPGLEVSYDYFNPLIYEYERGRGEGGGKTEQLVKLLMRAIEIADQIAKGKTTNTGDFWEKSVEALLTVTIGLLKLAHESKESDEEFTLTIKHINDFINSIPRGTNIEEGTYIHKVLDAAEERVNQLYAEHQNHGNQQIIKNYDPLKNAWKKAKAFYEDSENYIENQYIPMPEKQRGGIEGTWLTFAKYFRGDSLLAERFAQGIDDRLRPSVTMEGEQPKIIILDFPQKLFNEDGVLAQAYYKSVWQITVERRTREQVKNEKPSFCWIDEAQFFLTRRDQEFLTTTRESKCMTVLITQSKLNYDTLLGSTLSNALLGLVENIFFHWNDDPETNAWAVKKMGQDKIWKDSFSTGPDGRTSTNSQETYQNHIDPSDFMDLKPDYQNMYTYAYYFRGGDTFSNGKRYLPVVFDMKLGEREPPTHQKILAKIRMPDQLKEHLTRTIDPIYHQTLAFFRNIKLNVTALWHSTSSPASDQNTTRTE